jgi:hypothetical protein
MQISVSCATHRKPQPGSCTAGTCTASPTPQPAPRSAMTSHAHARSKVQRMAWQAEADAQKQCALHACQHFVVSMVLRVTGGPQSTEGDSPSAGATQRLSDCSTTGCIAWLRAPAPLAASSSGCARVCCCCDGAAGELLPHWPAPSSRAAATPGLPRSLSGCGGGSYRTAQSCSGKLPMVECQL